MCIVADMSRVDHDVLGQLTADKCPRLVGRPKLLFVQVWSLTYLDFNGACFNDQVQACQGQATDQGVNVTDR